MFKIFRTEALKMIVFGQNCPEIFCRRGVYKCPDRAKKLSENCPKIFPDKTRTTFGQFENCVLDEKQVYSRTSFGLLFGQFLSDISIFGRCLSAFIG